MTFGDDTRLKIIRAALEERAAVRPGAPGLTDAMLDVWDTMNTRLAPIIGAAGVEAVLHRALYLAHTRFSWFEINDKPGDMAGTLLAIRSRLEAQPADTAADASCALLAAFTGTLSSLIGDNLTEHLLGPAWIAPDDSRGEEPIP